MMAFGTTYCAISHLPIEDGDKCMLIPLGFRMNYEFDRYNKADINCFSYLYTFIRPAVEVIFEGNVSMVKYANKGEHNKKGDNYEEHEMFMLVHKGFYDKLLIEFNPEYLDNINMLPLCNSTHPIWEKCHEYRDHEQAIIFGRFNKKEISKELLSELINNIKPPMWIKELFQVAQFMGKMGIPAHPIFCNDQHQTGEMYEDIRSQFVKIKKPKKSAKKA